MLYVNVYIIYIFDVITELCCICTAAAVLYVSLVVSGNNEEGTAGRFPLQ